MRNCLWAIGILFAAALLGGCAASGSGESSVRMWAARLKLPTYLVGDPDHNPRFYTGRAYQGAQGRVYPYPMLDGLTDAREPVTYKALYLENEYIRVCVLPELGGRLFEAFDKTNGYHFVYRQHVIKPALIGMLGAWLSGGIELTKSSTQRRSTLVLQTLVAGRCCSLRVASLVH